MTRKGVAFLYVNSYLNNPSGLPPLIRIDEAIRDFHHTYYNVLRFQPSLNWDVTRDEMLYSLDRDLQAIKSSFSSMKYVAFHFIGHGRVGDILLMQDGGQVTTKEVVERFSQLPKEMYKFFFIDACRGGVSDELTPDQAYCPTLENSLLVRSALPHRVAHTGDTYGMWSKNFLTLLRSSTKTLEDTLKVVGRIVKEQPPQYTNSGVPDVSWAKEAQAEGVNLRATPPPIYESMMTLSIYSQFTELEEGLKRHREDLRMRDNGQVLGGMKSINEAEEVLVMFQEQFMCAIDAEAIVLELQHKDVISDSVQREVCTSRNQREKNALLFAHLKQTSTKESMIALCETIIDVKGNPRMKAFGEQMLQMLKGADFSLE